MTGNRMTLRGIRLPSSSSTRMGEGRNMTRLSIKRQLSHARNTATRALNDSGKSIHDSKSQRRRETCLGRQGGHLASVSARNDCVRMRAAPTSLHWRTAFLARFPTQAAHAGAPEGASGNSANMSCPDGRDAPLSVDAQNSLPLAS